MNAPMTTANSRSASALTAVASGLLLIVFSVFLLFPDTSVSSSLELPRLSPSRLDYQDAGSGTPQVVALTLRNSTEFNITNVQVIPSCGCVVDDFDVTDLRPNEFHKGELTLRNDKDDIRTSTILIQYQLNGSRVDELVEVSPQKQEKKI